ncbi:MAG: multidrug efflux SMR transporter [Gammaproteobacteria bacterium]|nr:multidrug efflux SMR transporter [Gammaproteobacteria bacterium]MYA36417.1 multidrug efflux SMR transporter [Gammaproteobacteria bacterium]MYH85249.1 multidrug efflux SMR transporter [Gammaproteobacteria bacterium]MYK03653.1 multidrug efflux SMR transporter [Gammaproteobacteria bacterium]
MAYLYLAGAIVFEVTGTMLLPVSQNFTRLLPSVVLIAAYSTSFYFLTFAIRDIPIAIVYASWAGLGVFLVALLSLMFYDQALPWQAIIGLVLIVSGVVLVNTYSGAHSA